MLEDEPAPTLDQKVLDNADLPSAANGEDVKTAKTIDEEKEVKDERLVERA